MDNQLQRYNARVSGSSDRKRERLERFVAHATNQNRVREHLHQVIRDEQEKVRIRQRIRQNEILTRSKTDSQCPALSVIFVWALVAIIVGVSWNCSRLIVFKV
jgi:hypothetical protein